MQENSPNINVVRTIDYMNIDDIKDYLQDIEIALSVNQYLHSIGEFEFGFCTNIQKPTIHYLQENDTFNHSLTEPAISITPITQSCLNGSCLNGSCLNGSYLKSSSKKQRTTIEQSPAPIIKLFVQPISTTIYNAVEAKVHNEIEILPTAYPNMREIKKQREVEKKEKLKAILSNQICKPKYASSFAKIAIEKEKKTTNVRTSSTKLDKGLKLTDKGFKLTAYQGKTREKIIKIKESVLNDNNREKIPPYFTNTVLDRTECSFYEKNLHSEKYSIPFHTIQTIDVEYLKENLKSALNKLIDRINQNRATLQDCERNEEQEKDWESQTIQSNALSANDIRDLRTYWTQNVVSRINRIYPCISVRRWIVRKLVEEYIYVQDIIQKYNANLDKSIPEIVQEGGEEIAIEAYFQALSDLPAIEEEINTYVKLVLTNIESIMQRISRYAERDIAETEQEIVTKAIYRIRSSIQLYENNVRRNAMSTAKQKDKNTNTILNQNTIDMNSKKRRKMQ